MAYWSNADGLKYRKDFVTHCVQPQAHPGQISKEHQKNIHKAMLTKIG